MKLTKRRLIHGGITLLGALAGFLYWRYVGCLGGSCPLWSNPWIATGYGGLFGFLLGMPGKKKAKDTHDNTEADTVQSTDSAS